MIKNLVSIIIPTFNSSLYIERTIRSILNQSYSNFEILIIDDCSKDFENLKNKIEGFLDDRIILNRLNSKAFASGARNYGVRIARGEYIAYLDSDDEWFEDKLQTDIQIIKKYENEDIVLYNAAIVEMPHKEIILPRIEKKDKERIATYKVINNGSIFTPTLFLKKVTADKVRWDENLKGDHEDFLYCLQLEEIGAKFIFINECLTKVHWDIKIAERKKRQNWIYSLNFFNNYNRYFTKREKEYFLINLAIYNCIRSKDIISGIKIIIFNKLMIKTILHIPNLMKSYFQNRLKFRY